MTLIWGNTAVTSENIRKSLDEGNFACSIFVDLQKAFDKVEHGTLLTKPGHYSFRRGHTNYWVKSSLSDRKQFVSMNGHGLKLASV